MKKMKFIGLFSMYYCYKSSTDIKKFNPEVNTKKKPCISDYPTYKAFRYNYYLVDYLAIYITSFTALITFSGVGRNSSIKTEEYGNDVSAELTRVIGASK